MTPNPPPTAEARCEATLPFNNAARHSWDVVVAGAGPAGAICAGLLAREGISVLLVDKSEFPREKVCGSCLNGAALAALQAAGLGDLLTTLHAVRLTSMRIRAGGREAELPLPAGAALSRRVFDQALVRSAIAAGAAFLPGAEAVLEPQAVSAKRIRIRSSRETIFVTARLAVAADGLGGGFLKAIDSMAPSVAPQAPLGAGAIIDGPSDVYGAGTISMGCTESGYVGVVRLEDGRLDVALALDRAAAQCAGGVAAAAAQLFCDSGLPCPVNLGRASFRGTPFLTRQRRRVADAGLVVIGDAAGYVEPLTGEGMAWAMQQALLAAPIVSEAIVRSDPNHVRRWQQEYERFFRGRRDVCRVATWMRRNIRLGRLAVAMLARAPWLATPWIRSVNRAAPQILWGIVS